MLVNVGKLHIGERIYHFTDRAIIHLVAGENPSVPQFAKQEAENVVHYPSVTQLINNCNGAKNNGWSKLSVKRDGVLVSLAQLKVDAGSSG